MNAKTKTRELWLGQMARKSVALFKKAGYELDLSKVRVSVGWPGRGGAKGKSIGECWSSVVSKDDHTEIFINPRLDNGVRVADVLIHELVHHVVGHAAGHGPIFRKCAVALGLEGHMTATVAGAELVEWIQKQVKVLGDYPHGAMTGMAPTTPKQGTRLIKVFCPDCGYIARVTGKWLGELGAPICPCNGHPMKIAG